MPWVGFQQGKLLVGNVADVFGQRRILLPKVGGRTMFHSALERLCPAIALVVKRATDCCIETACSKVGLYARINGLGMVLVKPRIQFLQLLLGELVYRAFNVKYAI